jgi:hypothetical protein
MGILAEKAAGYPDANRPSLVKGSFGFATLNPFGVWDFF